MISKETEKLIDTALGAVITAAVVVFGLSIFYPREKPLPAEVQIVAVAQDGPLEYKGEGLATWYAAGRCADGSKFTGRDYTCAAREFKRGTFLILEGPNGVRRPARVNDYGPRDTSRRLDISKRLAADFGMVSRGVGRVKIWQVINP